MPHHDPDRLSQIERVTAELIGRSGYYATSLQSIADEVGITKAGLLHYVGNKDNLLTMVMRDYDADGMAAAGLVMPDMAKDAGGRGDDAAANPGEAPESDERTKPGERTESDECTEPDEHAGPNEPRQTDAAAEQEGASGTPGPGRSGRHEEPKNGRPSRKRSVPGYFRRLAETNAKRPEFVRLFTMLNTETLNPDHPARAYFREREAMLEREAADPRWDIPEGVDGEAAIMAAFMAMDGIQIKWLREPGRDLVAMWRRIEPALFPPVVWGTPDDDADAGADPDAGDGPDHRADLPAGDAAD